MNEDELFGPDTDNWLPLTSNKRLKHFAAKCKFCDENSPEKRFRQGNSSNLKSHLQKVNSFFSNFE